jgi:hypothetical protein
MKTSISTAAMEFVQCGHEVALKLCCTTGLGHHASAARATGLLDLGALDKLDIIGGSSAMGSPLQGSSGVSPVDGAWDAMSTLDHGLHSILVQLGLLLKHPDTHSFPRQIPHDGSPGVLRLFLKFRKEELL